MLGKSAELMESLADDDDSSAIGLDCRRRLELRPRLPVRGEIGRERDEQLLGKIRRLARCNKTGSKGSAGGCGARTIESPDFRQFLQRIVFMHTESEALHCY